MEHGSGDSRVERGLTLHPGQWPPRNNIPTPAQHLPPRRAPVAVERRIKTGRENIRSNDGRSRCRSDQKRVRVHQGTICARNVGLTRATFNLALLRAGNLLLNVALKLRVTLDVASGITADAITLSFSYRELSFYLAPLRFSSPFSDKLDFNSIARCCILRKEYLKSKRYLFGGHQQHIYLSRNSFISME